MRSLPILLAACIAFVALASAPTAGAGTRRATDSEARIRFTLDDRLLTVRVLPGAPRRVRRQLYGNRIRATCGTSFVFISGVKVDRTRLWPRGRRRVRFRFRRNISRRAKWCLLERRGRDVALAGFTSR
ncbi:MAG: hypothetical protein ICV69_08825 [Thermoleophilaceae bacterium]|nr:hypothetical protein [Thermoleophilaceae bacterium]